MSKITPKHPLDKFYTKDYIAEWCISVTKQYVDEGVHYIEPSAGCGTFSKLLENVTAIDIEPEADDIIKMDYFDYTIIHDSVVIGNPPFGSRNKLTKEFIKHSLAANVIAFILPKVFRKESLQSAFPEEWSLVYDDDVPDNAFTINGNDYHVPCCFQIWIKGDYVYENLRESVKTPFETDDFSFIDDGMKFMFGASPKKIIDIGEVTRNNRGYRIDANDDVLERLKALPWNDYALSSVNGGVAWFSKKQIINIYGHYYYDHPL